MSVRVTNMLGSIYTYKTILKLTDSSYKSAHDLIVSEYETAKGSPCDSTEKTFFKSLEKPVNLGLINMMLYTTIVGTFESFVTNGVSMPGFSTIFKISNIVQSDRAYNRINLHYLLRRLRNSVSHYKYTYDGTEFVFKDDRDGSDLFEAKFTVSELDDLIQKVTEFCVNNCTLKPPL